MKLFKFIHMRNVFKLTVKYDEKYMSVILYKLAVINVLYIKTKICKEKHKCLQPCKSILKIQKDQTKYK